MIFISILFAFLGVIAPTTQVSLLSALLLLYGIMGVLAGYASTKLLDYFTTMTERTSTQQRDLPTYSTLSHANIHPLPGLAPNNRNPAAASTSPHYLSVTFATGLCFPAIAFAVLGSMFFAVSYVKEGDPTVPRTLLSLLVLWLCVSIPLVFLGGYVALHTRPYVAPRHVNAIPRKIPPPAHFFQRKWFTVMVGAVFTFAPCFVELQYIMHTLWLHQLYTAFGFLFLLFLVFLVNTAEASVLTTYLHLTAGDYDWWWRPFFTCGSSALLLLFYATVYIIQASSLASGLATLLFLGFIIIFTVTFFILTGTIGFWASFAFVHYMYASLKD